MGFFDFLTGKKNKNRVDLCIVDEETVRAFENIDLDHLNVAEATRQKIKKIIIEGKIEGLSYKSIEKQILEIPNTQLSKEEVKSIVHTATMKGFNKGAEERYKSANVEQFEFSSSNDEGVCAQCKSLDGKIFNMADPKSPKPPIHDGCRCGILPVISVPP